jgi:hypothetical protein
MFGHLGNAQFFGAIIMEKDTSAIHSDYAAAKIEQNDIGATPNFHVRRLN